MSRCFDVFFDLRLNKRLSKHSRRRWFETPSRSLWRHCNYYIYTETEMSSFWWNFHHWLHWKLSKWQLPVQPVMKISSKWRHFRFSVYHMIYFDVIVSILDISRSVTTRCDTEHNNNSRIVVRPEIANNMPYFLGKMVAKYQPRFGSTSIKHRSDESDRCLIDVDPTVFTVCNDVLCLGLLESLNFAPCIFFCFHNLGWWLFEAVSFGWRNINRSIQWIH